MLDLRRLALSVLALATVLVHGSAAIENKRSCTPGSHPLPDPSSNSEDPVAPDVFLVTLHTTVSDQPVVMEVRRAWAPLGVDRFYQLLQDRFYDCASFFRVVPGFVTQFGIAAEVNETAKWNVPITDDPGVGRSNLRGTLSFATAGVDTRTTQLFVNLQDNPFLDRQGFVPFAQVHYGMDFIDAIYNPTPDDSDGVDQYKLSHRGNDWLLDQYPEIDLILSVEVEAVSIEEERVLRDLAQCTPRGHVLQEGDAGQAPASFQVAFSTSISDEPIVIEAYREWAPLGVDRFYALVQDNYYDCSVFHRFAPGFVVQFGIASDPAETDKWSDPILDDPVEQSNDESYVTFATAGEDTRTTQVFINIGDNWELNNRGFAPFGKVIKGYDLVKKIYNPTPEDVGGVDQDDLSTKGSSWAFSEYPKLDFVKNTKILSTSDKPLAEADDGTCVPRAHDINPNNIEEAPEAFVVEFHTTASSRPIVIQVARDWSPIGVDRFYALLQDNFYDCATFFRVAPNFVVQYGIAAEPSQTQKWSDPISDDPVTQSNLKGFVTFATSGSDTRTAQIFINLKDNASLDSKGFTPFGEVISGLDVVESFYNPTPGDQGGANQGKLRSQGNEWILNEYPDIDYVKFTDITSTSKKGGDTEGGSSESPSKTSAESEFLRTAGGAWIYVVALIEITIALTYFR